MPGQFEKGPENAGTKISEPLTVWRGTVVERKFDGKNWTQEYQDENTGEWSTGDVADYTLEDLAEEYALSLADGINRHLQSDVDPSSGRSVQFSNPGSEQAKLFRNIVSEKVSKLIGRKYSLD